MNNHPQDEFINALYRSMAAIIRATELGYERSCDTCDPRFIKERAQLNSLRLGLEVMIDIEKERQSCKT